MENNNLSIKLSSLDHFYSEANKLEDTGRSTIWEAYNNGSSVNSYFQGLSYEEIMKSKYSYRKGLDKLKDIEEDFNLGGTTRKFKYDEFDGDDMNFDRYIEQLPSLKKRIRTIGIGSGKFINIHVNIAELAGVSSGSLMTRSYTVMRIVDYLENLGYRVGISIYTDTHNVGSLKGEKIDLLHVEVQIKKPEEPLLRSLVLTSISSWAFRYWMFKFRAAKLMVDSGMGSTASLDYEDTKSDLYIRRGECLTEDSAKNRISQISKYYSNL